MESLNKTVQVNQDLAVAPAPPSARTAGYVDVPSRYSPGADDAAPGGLLEYWNILRRRKVTVLLFAVVGTLGAILLTLPQTPVYQARTSIEIQTMNQEFMNM